eukprot:1934560-Rhodomonas_salina.2
MHVRIAHDDMYVRIAQDGIDTHSMCSERDRTNSEGGFKDRTPCCLLQRCEDSSCEEGCRDSRCEEGCRGSSCRKKDAEKYDELLLKEEQTTINLRKQRVRCVGTQK